MSAILFVFGSLEALLLVVCLLTFLWGIFRDWELEILLPMVWGVRGTVALGVLFLIVSFVHDHLSVGFSLK